jgi:hypothetical protein
VPPGATVTLNGESLQAVMHSALKQLIDQDYDAPSARTPEFPAAFENAFWDGVNDAITEYKAKASDKLICQAEQ